LLENTYSKFGVGAGKGSITCEKIGDLYSDPLNMLSENTCSSSSPLGRRRWTGAQFAVVRVVDHFKQLQHIVVFELFKNGNLFAYSRLREHGVIIRRLDSVKVVVRRVKCEAHLRVNPSTKILDDDVLVQLFVLRSVVGNRRRCHRGGVFR
jgi:hypothetical protein